MLREDREQPRSFFLLFILFILFYLFMIVTEKERGRDTGRGRSRLHALGTRCGIRSRVSGIVPWAKGRRQTAAPPRDPLILLFKKYHILGDILYFSSLVPYLIVTVLDIIVSIELFKGLHEFFLLKFSISIY